LAFEGLLKPESLRTNWSAEARISSSVAGGEKLCSVLMLRHIRILLSQQALQPYVANATGGWKRFTAREQATIKSTSTRPWAIKNGGFDWVGASSASAGIFWNDCTTSTKQL